ncbi:MAG: glycosyltransferase [Pseudomonadota bacterium]
MESNTDEVKVSVVMPVYNGEAFLDEAVQSVLSQSFTNFEVIAVDDGSSDATPEILARHAAIDPRLRVHRQANSGIVGALNAGLALARGAYIARMDADDVCLPDRFARQVAHLDASPETVLVGGLAETIDAEGRPLAVVSGGPHRRTDLTSFPPRVAVSLHPLIMVRREALARIGGYREGFAHAEDYDLYLRLAPLGAIDNPDMVMLRYRKHDGAISQRNIAVQERSAALAEIDAVATAQGGAAGSPPRPNAIGIAEETFEAYVRFRIWRRLQDYYPGEAARARRGVLGDVLHPRRLADATHHRLRLRMAAGLLKGSLRRLSRAGETGGRGGGGAKEQAS